LHGHGLEDSAVRAVASEALGTFVLVLAIISTAIAAQLSEAVAGAPYDSLTVPLAGGFALVVVVTSFGHISGAHLNPAVTVGLALNGRFPVKRVPGYLAAQLTGAIVAALAAWLLFGDRARYAASLGATLPAPGVDIGRVFAAEGIVTFVLVLVVLAVATDRRVPQGTAAVAIGLALAAAIFISGPISGAAVNPARALRPMIVADRFRDWWVYLIAPLAGGAIAATLFHVFLYDPALGPSDEP
jgi:MIP family channel proteins